MTIETPQFLINKRVCKSQRWALVCRIWHIRSVSSTVSYYYSINMYTRSSAIAEIARVCDHYAVQGHSGSLILIPIESQSPYTTSYSEWYKLTFYLAPFSSYRTVKLLPLTGVSLFNIRVLSNLCEYRHKSYTRFGVNSRRIQCNNANSCHYAVLYYSRSPILVPTESPCATFY